MANILVVARKEFSDLCNSWLVLVILLVYLLSIVLAVYGYYEISRQGVISGLANSLLNGLWYVLTFYGMFVGIVVGFSSIAGEKHSKALNILLVKPLYRDTVINGKLLGITGFICCVLWVTIALFTSAVFIVFGDQFSAVFITYAESLPLLFVLAVGYVLIFTLLSTLIAILVRDQAFALIFTVLLVFIFDISRTNNVAGFLSIILSGGYNPVLAQSIAHWSPTDLINSIGVCLYPPTLPNGAVLMSTYSIDTLGLTLAIFLVIALVTSYIAFNRWDIS